MTDWLSAKDLMTSWEINTSELLNKIKFGLTAYIDANMSYNIPVRPPFIDLSGDIPEDPYPKMGSNQKIKDKNFRAISSPEIDSFNTNDEDENKNRMSIFLFDPKEVREYEIKHNIQVKEQEIKPLNLPPGTEWEDITIEFLNEEDVHIYIKEEPFSDSDYKQLGFKEKGKTKPIMLWTYLKKFGKGKGKITYPQPASDSLRTYMKSLNQGLKKCFRVDDETPPIINSKKQQSYECKIKLIYNEE